MCWGECFFFSYLSFNVSYFITANPEREGGRLFFVLCCAVLSTCSCGLCVLACGRVRETVRGGGGYFDF